MRISKGTAAVPSAVGCHRAMLTPVTYACSGYPKQTLSLHQNSNGQTPAQCATSPRSGAASSKFMSDMLLAASRALNTSRERFKNASVQEYVDLGRSDGKEMRRRGSGLLALTSAKACCSSDAQTRRMTLQSRCASTGGLLHLTRLSRHKISVQCNAAKSRHPSSVPVRFQACRHGNKTDQCFSGNCNFWRRPPAESVPQCARGPKASRVTPGWPDLLLN